MRYFHRFIGCIALLMGCQNAAGPGLVPVTGTVHLDGKPLAHALVTFIPDGDTRGVGSEAVTNESGEFKLRSRRSGDGAVAGTYRVTISKRLMPDGSEPVGEDKNSPITSAARETLPATYSSRQKTTLTARVTEGGPPLEFSLKSK
jgi:hypothetical protein